MPSCVAIWELSSCAAHSIADAGVKRNKFGRLSATRANRDPRGIETVRCPSPCCTQQPPVSAIENLPGGASRQKKETKEHFRNDFAARFVNVFGKTIIIVSRWLSFCFVWYHCHTSINNMTVFFVFFNCSFRRKLQSCAPVIALLVPNVSVCVCASMRARVCIQHS